LIDNFLAGADYLIKKISLLRAAGTTDPESMKSELWEGLDYRLASLVLGYPDYNLQANCGGNYWQANRYCFPQLQGDSTVKQKVE
jgi:hypothetical protein